MDALQGQGMYLEERMLEKRFKGPWSAIITLLFSLAVFALTWWIFQDPRGIMRMYTPFLGYMYCRWLLIIFIWVAYIFNFWPFKRSWLNKTHPVLKGIILTVFSLVVLQILVKVFFEGMMGRMAIAYFNPDQIMEGPMKITKFFAEEYAAEAIMMFAAIASWLSPSWIVACEGAPWEKMTQPRKGFSIWLVTFFMSFLVYFMTMHGHMGILYYPWQYFSGIAAPYWESFAGTVSGNFHIAWIMCGTVVVWLVETIWERYPFSLIKKDWVRRVTTFFGIIAISFALCFFLYFAQELIWGPAIRGTRRLMAPDWRWLHVGETAIFFLVPSLFITFFCGNWPKKFSRPVNVIVRTGVCIVAAAAFYWFYYSTGHLYLGIQKGFSHPQQFPMIPTIWLINIWLIIYWFMDGWPGWKMRPKTAAEIEETHKDMRRTDVTWTKKFKLGLITGIVAGVVLYFAVIYLLPSIGNLLSIHFF